MDSPLKSLMKDRLEKLLVTWMKPSFHAWILGNILIVTEAVEKPNFIQYCAGTGMLIAANGLRKLFINRNGGE